MRHLLSWFVVLATVVSVALVGCAPAAPAAPTAAPAPATGKVEAPAKPAVAPTAVPKPAEPTKLAEPTKAAQAAPQKVDYPQKGKAINFIIGWPAGGSADVTGRVMAAALEKELGIPVQVVNRGGASSQIGMQETALAKPDGYNLGYAALPTAILTYVDPERKASYSGKDFIPLANQAFDPTVWSVPTGSPFKTMKDLVDTAKAKPEQIKVGTAGILSTGHLPALSLEKLTGAKFSYVHFEGVAPAVTAALGGHVDVVPNTAGSFLSQVKSGQLRIIGVMDTQETKAYPGVKTLEAQGYKLYSAATRGVIAPAGVPKEILDVLGVALERAIKSEEYVKKLEDVGAGVRYMNAAQYAAHWAETEAEAKDLIAIAKK